MANVPEDINLDEVTKSDMKVHVVDDVSGDEQQEEEPLFKQRTYKELCCNFAENNSFHGIPYIAKAPNWYSRLLWTSAFLVFMAAWILHTFFLIVVYLKYETTPALNIKYEALEFPSVTICNINPMRASYIRTYGSEELQEFLMANTPPSDYMTNVPGQNIPGQTPSNAPGGRKKRQSPPEPPFDGLPTQGIPERLEPINDNDFGQGNTSDSLVAYQQFKTLFTNIDPSNRTIMGHQKESLILRCSFNGLECTTNDFVLYETSDYGNCYVFNSASNRSSSFRSARSGAIYGLDLILYIEDNEYLAGLPLGRGVRMYVHPFKTSSDVAQNGISLAPGLQTLVGITMLNSSLLGGVYGKCDDNGTYERYYGLKYSQQSCTRTCLDRTIAHSCGCMRNDHFENYNKDDRANLPSCIDDMSNLICAENIEILNDHNKVKCNCRPPCKHTEYTYRITDSVWPDDSYWFTLVDTVCGVDKEQCDFLRGAGVEVLRENFLNLRLYYRDLNYKEFEEQALYEEAQFISDMGGCIGLWVGASAITVIEMIDFLFKCCDFSIWRNKHKHRHLENERAYRFGEQEQEVVGDRNKENVEENEEEI